MSVSPVIVAGVRTPFVKASGELRQTSAQELGRLVVAELLARLDLPQSTVDEVIAGSVGGSVDAANIARVIALQAGIPAARIAHTVNRNCASGFEAITQSIDRIRAGHARCIVAVGVESLSNAPLIWSRQAVEKLLRFYRSKSLLGKLKTLLSVRPADLKPLFTLELGLTDPVSGLIMGSTAEVLAREFGISRQEQDRFALESHERASKAWTIGRLADEVMPVYPLPGCEAITRDIGFRSEQTIEALAKLKPFFDRRYGSVTVGNSSQVTDGAAAVLVMEEELARSLGYRPLGRLRSYAYAGCDPKRMGLGPVFATWKVLADTKIALRDIELMELNEAFAAQVLACAKAFSTDQFAKEQLGQASRLGELDFSRLNVNGGAIALGHPVGATGTRLVLTLLLELRRRNLALGLASACAGGGQGAALLLETV